MAKKSCFISADTECWAYCDGVQLARIMPSPRYSEEILVEENSILSFVSCKYGWAVYHDARFPNPYPYGLLHPTCIDVFLREEEKSFEEELSVSDNDRKYCVKDYQYLLYTYGRRKLTGWDNGWPIGWHPSFEKLTIDDRCTIICNDALYGCRELKYIHIPEGVIGIGDNAFGGCEYLEEVVLPDSLRYIGRRAFSGCGLKRVIVPAKVCVIGAGAFANCGLEEVLFLSPYLDIIPEHLFYGCGRLTSVHLPNNIVCIEEEAFMGTYELKTLELPSTVRSIVNNAFWDSGLEDIIDIK